MSRRKPVEAFTDGNTHGYGVVLLYGERITKIKSDYYQRTTVTRMELKGVIRALEEIKPGYDIYLYCDSKMIMDNINTNIAKWTETGEFHTKNDYTLYVRFLRLKKKHLEAGGNLYFNWIRGHCGNKYNVMADELASEAKKKSKKKKQCKTDN